MSASMQNVFVFLSQFTINKLVFMTVHVIIIISMCCACMVSIYHGVLQVCVRAMDLTPSW